MLAMHPECTEAAIQELQTFVRDDSHALSDIAAAWYLRAEREQNPLHFLRAFEAAERATTFLPDDPAARFNLALIQEALGLNEQARASWKPIASGDDAWAATARSHLRRLSIPAGTAQWRRNASELAVALKKRDHAAVRRLIAGFPTPAKTYFDVHAKDMATEEAALFESELSLRRGSEHALGHKESQRGFALTTEDRHLDALKAYDAALPIFTRARDTEMIASVQRSRAGAYNAMGLYEEALLAAMTVIRDAEKIVNIRRKNSLLGEAGNAVIGLGYPTVGLSYAEEAVTSLRAEMPHAPTTGVDVTEGVPANLVVALRARAEVQLRLELYAEADRDIDEVRELTESEEAADTDRFREIQARIHEVRGRSVLRRSPIRALQLFTAALETIPEGVLHTFKATLYAERAEAASILHRNVEAGNDLERAVDELRQEESAQLAARNRGEEESVWTAYFSRFDNTWDELVRQRMQLGQYERAYEDDERSRGFEPLDLILRSGLAPESFRKLVPHGEPMRRAAIQKLLPPGTALIQYCVRSEGTYAWVLMRDRFEPVILRVQREQVQRWSDTIQRQRLRPAAVDDALQDAFTQLMEAPLKIASRGGKPNRIVIVPDGPMHGLPFAALHNRDTAEYLIQQAPIELAGSATLYVFSLLRDQSMRSVTPPTALLVGDPDFDENFPLARNLRRLNHASSEVDEIRNFYAPHVTVLKDRNATVAAFLEAANDQPLIHFAGHSIINVQKPWRSVLLFARKGEDSGAIEAQQLLKQVKLDRTRLVVLAACSTAGGQPAGPAGVAPLVRPLLTAGVPAVMGTLWSVDDATAETLSVSFHRDYERGSDAAMALQAAQLRMLRDGLGPLSWAPYQVIGHASSPFGSTHK